MTDVKDEAKKIRELAERSNRGKQFTYQELADVVTPQAVLLILDKFDRLNEFVDIVGKHGSGYPSNVLPLLEERDKLLEVLSAARKYMDSKDLRYGPYELFEKVKACSDIKTKDQAESVVSKGMANRIEE